MIMMKFVMIILKFVFEEIVFHTVVVFFRQDTKTEASQRGSTG